MKNYLLYTFTLILISLLQAKEKEDIIILEIAKTHSQSSKSIIYKIPNGYKIKNKKGAKALPTTIKNRLLSFPSQLKLKTFNTNFSLPSINTIVNVKKLKSRMYQITGSIKGTKKQANFLKLELAVTLIKEENKNTIEFEDGKTNGALGNNDHVINTFEIIKFSGCFSKFNSATSQITLSLPKGVYCVVKPKVEVEKNTKFSFSLCISDAFTLSNLEFSVKLYDNNTLLDEIMHSVVVQHTTFGEHYLSNNYSHSKNFDYESKGEVDRFLLNFPDSKEASLIFRIRFEYCRKIRDEALNGQVHIQKAIREYNEFIHKYPNKILSIVALQECFELYRLMNTVDLYYDFISKYPISQYALVAEEHIKKLSFMKLEKSFKALNIKSLVDGDNILEACKSFLYLYPDQMYRKKCITIASQILIARENLLLQKSDTDKIARIKQLKNQISEVLREYSNINDPFEKVTKYLGDTRIEQVIEVLYAVYPQETSEFRILFRQQRNIIELTIGLKKYLDDLSKSFLQKVENRFDQLDSKIDRNFELIKSVSKDLKLVLRNQQEIKKLANILRNDIKKLRLEVHQNFEMVKKRLDKIDFLLKKSNERFTLSLPKLNLPKFFVDKVLKNKTLQNAVGKIFGTDIVAKIKTGIVIVKTFYSGYQTIKPMFITGTVKKSFSNSISIYGITSRMLKNKQVTNDIILNEKNLTFAYANIKDQSFEIHFQNKKNELYSSVNNALLKLQNKEILIFIHGYNVDIKNSFYTTAKIADKLKFQGVSIAYSWPSQSSLIYYGADRATAPIAGKYLINFLNKLAKNVKYDKLHIIAHSMGNYVLAEALKLNNEKLKIDNTILIAPDLDSRYFETTLAGIFKRYSKSIAIYTSKNDWALFFSKKIHKYPRVGDVNSMNIPFTIIKGIETIDASSAKSNYICHSHHEDPRVISDINEIFSGNSQRKLNLIECSQGVFWRLLDNHEN